MRLSLISLIVLPLLTGCSTLGLSDKKSSQPYITSARLDRGLVVVLTGIEGRSPLNEEIVAGLDRGGVKCAIELYDWTATQFMPLVNQESGSRNRRVAQELAERITRYRWAYPDRPVVLVGQSGGAAMAAWTAESLQNEKVDGIIMLASSLSTGYRLDGALRNSNRGVVNFYSGRDVVLLGLGTKIFRTMDGEFSTSAGMGGFVVPDPEPREYRKLFQIGWNKRMAECGNTGLHVTSGAEAFVAQYVAPFVTTYRWDNHMATQVANNETRKSPRPAAKS